MLARNGPSWTNRLTAREQSVGIPLLKSATGLIVAPLGRRNWSGSASGSESMSHDGIANSSRRLSGIGISTSWRIVSLSNRRAVGCDHAPPAIAGDRHDRRVNLDHRDTLEPDLAVRQ